MSGDGAESFAEAELNRRVAQWAAARRIDEARLAAIRAAVLAPSLVVDSAPDFDADWLWRLLRPVTDLIDVAESTLPRRFDKWLDPVVRDRPYQPYLRLA